MPETKQNVQPAEKSGDQRRAIPPVLWPIFGLCALLVYNALFGRNFFEIRIVQGHLYGNLIDIVNVGSRWMLLALGMTLVIATGGVDLSVGSIMAISGAVGAVLVLALPGPIEAMLGSEILGVNVPVVGSFLIAALAALVVCTLIGLLNGTLVAVFRVQPIVATLILMVAGRGVALLITQGQITTFTNPAYSYLANGHLAGIPFAVFIVAVFYLAAWFFTRRTAAGLFIEATGDNETAGRYAGVPVVRVRLLVYAFSGFCAGMAGLLAASNIKGADSARVGEYMELDAIFAVVVGGTALTGGRFTLLGALIGALLIRTLTVTMYNRGVPPDVAPVFKAVVIVAVCLVQSSAFRTKIRRLFP